MNFRERNDAELAKLDDEALIRYIVDARRAGRLDAAVQGAQILAFRYEPRIRGFVHSRLGNRGQLVVDEVAETTLADAIASMDSFAGSTVAEFRAWVFQIARRRVIDHLRDRKRRKDRVEEEPLEVDWGEGPEERKRGKGHAAPVPQTAIDEASIFNQAYSELSDAHKLVICLVRLYGLPHKKAAEQVNRHFGGQLNDPMTEQNVNQINSRFDKRLDQLLDEADHPPPPDEPEDDG